MDAQALSARQVRISDGLLILIMATLAACGLIYEYLLSHYAGRVLGSMETAIYSMIGIMIVSMGLGAFAARKIDKVFPGFAWLEVSVAALGATTVSIISLLIGWAHLLPQVVAHNYGLTPEIVFETGIPGLLFDVAMSLPYVFGFLLGFLIGVEIPLMARIRETFHGKHLKNNAGTIYGADYIGAGVGAALWVTLMLKIDINKAAAMTASLNLICGLVFLFRFRDYIPKLKTLVCAHAFGFLIVGIIYFQGPMWQKQLQDMLYLDEVVHQQQTPFQNLVLTDKPMSNGDSIMNLYINGNIQFSSMDEHIYHEMMVYPAMLAAARHDNILIIGGGDGLALREVQKFSPKAVTLVDIDQQMVELFKHPDQYAAPFVANKIKELTKNSLSAENLKLVYQDAFLYADALIAERSKFDVIIVDLPDPKHPDLNKLYSVGFYVKLKSILTGDGALVVQSNSPYHAKEAFISIGKTIKASGFKAAEQYHQNVPTFGEWGWTLAQPLAPSGNNLRDKIQQSWHTMPDSQWVSKPLIEASFEFPKGFFAKEDDIEFNRLGSHQLYQYHQKAWVEDSGFVSKVGE